MMFELVESISFDLKLKSEDAWRLSSELCVSFFGRMISKKSFLTIRNLRISAWEDARSVSMVWIVNSGQSAHQSWASLVSNNLFI